VGAVRVLVVLPLVRLLGDEAPFATAATERLGVLGRDALLREVLPPGVHQAGVQHGDIDARPVVVHLTVVEAVVRHVDGVEIPGREAVREIGCRDRVHRRALALRIRVGRRHVRQRTDGLQIPLLRLHGQRVNGGQDVRHTAVGPEVGQDGVGNGHSQHDVDADGLAGRGGLHAERADQHHADDEHTGKDATLHCRTLL